MSEPNADSVPPRRPWDRDYEVNPLPLGNPGPPSETWRFLQVAWPMLVIGAVLGTVIGVIGLRVEPPWVGLYGGASFAVGIGWGAVVASLTMTRRRAQIDGSETP